ncbi:MAG: hypothetical protein KJ821_03220 [Actinobacteria bacterium]|nr:hypothetical protein [Actinomycetota bacterium]
MTEDMKKAVATLMPFLPRRLFREPLKVIKEIYAVLRKDNGNSNIKKR